MDEAEALTCCFTGPGEAAVRPPRQAAGLRGLPGFPFSLPIWLLTRMLGKMKLHSRWEAFVKVKSLIYLQGESFCLLAF